MIAITSVLITVTFGTAMYYMCMELLGLPLGLCLVISGVAVMFVMWIIVMFMSTFNEDEKKPEVKV
jgi:hypothetical protein